MVFMTRWQVSMRPPCASGVPLAASTRCCCEALRRRFFAGGPCFDVNAGSLLESDRLVRAGVRFSCAGGGGAAVGGGGGGGGGDLCWASALGGLCFRGRRLRRDSW